MSDGLRAKYVRKPYANVGLFTLPNNADDKQAIRISDNFPTAYFRAVFAR